MTAFLELLQGYAIFIYIAGVLAVLFGIKMLFDARRAGRTTLFTLEQEQAGDRAFRAVLVMLGATVLIAAVAGINAFVAPALPTPEPDVVPPTAIPFTPPVILDTATPRPTLTLAPATSAVATVTQTRAATATAAAVVTAAVGTPAPTAPVEPPTAVPPPTSVLVYQAPTLNVPPNGDSIGSDKVRFSWGVDEFGNLAIPAELPQDQFFRLVINFTDKTKNAPSALVLCTHVNSVDQRTGVNVADYRNEAVDNVFTWNVTMVSAASQPACESGEFSPLSPQSGSSSFKLP